MSHTDGTPDAPDEQRSSGAADAPGDPLAPQAAPDDSVLLTARGIRKSFGDNEVLRSIDLEVRAGLHTGEITMAGGNARGVAVHAAARIAALAGPGEVLVSGTTHDLLDGSGLAFVSLGSHDLKGLDGARPIFSLIRA